MKPGKAFWIWFVIALLMIFVGSEAQSYELYTDEPKWEDVYEYKISSSCPDEQFEAIKFWMDRYNTVHPNKFIGQTSARVSTRNFANVFWCDDNFGDSLRKWLPGIEMIEEEIVSEISNAVVGRATFWRYEGGDEILEADIQLAVDIDAEDLDHIIIHEIGHAYGCSHSKDLNAVMYPSVLTPHTMHYDDFRCLDHLYGPLTFSAVGWKGNLFLPNVQQWGEREGWAKVIKYSVGDYGVMEVNRE